MSNAVPAAPAVSLKEQWEAIKEMAAYAEMEWGETSDTGEKGWWESLSRRLRAAEATLRKHERLVRFVEEIASPRSEDALRNSPAIARALLSCLAERTALGGK